ncbi:hypothetical protein EAI_07283, partial [Harpegnathos saltator]
PCDSFLFPKLKRTLKGQRFSTTIDEIKAIPKGGRSHQCFSTSKPRWYKYM